MNRKQALKTIAAGTMASVAVPAFSNTENKKPKMKNNINHSVCQWCYGSIPLEELVIAAKEIGIKSVELLQPSEWAITQKHGLTCAMGYASSFGLNKGFNDVSLHEQLLKEYSINIPKA